MTKTATLPKTLYFLKKYKTPQKEISLRGFYKPIDEIALCVYICIDGILFNELPAWRHLISH